MAFGERKLAVYLSRARALRIGTTMEVAYKVGDLFLAEWPYLKEVEIQEVSQTAKALKIDGSWCEAASFHSKVKGKLGHVELKPWFFGMKRVVVKT